MSDLIDRQLSQKNDSNTLEALDCVSRQAAIDALCDNCDHVQAVCAHYPCKQYIAVEKLPALSASELIPKEWDETYRIARVWIFALRKYYELVQNHEIQRVKHGKWECVPDEYDDLTYKCSVCGEFWTLNDGTLEAYGMHYCPNCGAKMEG